MIDQKFRDVFQIFLKNSLVLKTEASDFWRNQAKTMAYSFQNTLKVCTMVSVYFFQK